MITYGSLAIQGGSHTHSAFRWLARACSGGSTCSALPLRGSSLCSPWVRAHCCYIPCIGMHVGHVGRLQRLGATASPLLIVSMMLACCSMKSGGWLVSTDRTVRDKLMQYSVADTAFAIGINFFQSGGCTFWQYALYRRQLTLHAIANAPSGARRPVMAIG